MHRIPAALFFIALLFFVGCSTMQSISVGQRTRIFHASYDTVVVAVADYCNEQGFPIATIDHKVGILNTDYRENDGTSKFLFGNFRGKLNFQFKRLAPDATRVIANASAEHQGAFGVYTQATLSENDAAKTYAEIFAKIQARLPQGTDPPSFDTSLPGTSIKPSDVRPGKTPRMKLKRSLSIMDIVIVSETATEIVYTLAGENREGRALKSEIEFIIMTDGTVVLFGK